MTQSLKTHLGVYSSEVSKVGVLHSLLNILAVAYINHQGKTGGQEAEKGIGKDFYLDKAPYFSPDHSTHSRCRILAGKLPQPSAFGSKRVDPSPRVFFRTFVARGGDSTCGPVSIPVRQINEKVRHHVQISSSFRGGHC